MQMYKYDVLPAYRAVQYSEGASGFAVIGVCLLLISISSAILAPAHWYISLLDGVLFFLGLIFYISSLVICYQERSIEENDLFFYEHGTPLRAVNND